MKASIFIVSAILMLGTLAGCSGSTGEGGGNYNISWSAPSTRVDGTTMSAAEISGYRISYGSDPTNLDQVQNVSPSVDSLTLADIPTGTWYFWVQTIDSNGRVGPPSQINLVTIR